jgi:tetratricopeptide (TPR) repeat protein
VVVAVSVSGCAALGIKPNGIYGEKLFEEYIQKGSAYEDGGNLVAAHEQYRLAMTVNPSNEEAIKRAKKVKKTLRRMAEQHYKAGLKLNSEGKYGRGRQQLLIALRLRPDYPEVVSMLTNRKRVQIKRYVVHTVKTGESVAKLAKMYYGDSQKFSIIAKYNDFIDATQIDVGQKIKIPEIEGMDFLAGRESIETEELSTPDLDLADWAWKEYALEEREEPVDQVAIYRNHGIDLYRKREYQLALVEFVKVLNAQPDDSSVMVYSHKSHYRIAMNLFRKKNFLGARKHFEAARRYQSECDKCDLYIERCEELHKEMHYKSGIQYFDQEQLSEAIREWELVRQIDPNYKKVNDFIDKAKRLLRKIEELRETQKG